MATDNPNEILYLNDCYLTEWNTRIKSVNGKYITLEQTAFYPSSGGQPNDVGEIIRKEDNERFSVVYVGKFDGEISHEVDKEGLKQGEEVKCIINWERRHRLMRMHTAAHILSKIIFDETGALITGNQLALDKSRIDFSLEDFNKDYFKKVEEKANEIVNKELQILFEFKSREEVESDGTKLAKGLPENIKTFRIVNIKGFDKQICGGTHVSNTKEIGNIKFVGFKNKGKNNRRVYYVLEA